MFTMLECLVEIHNFLQKKVWKTILAFFNRRFSQIFIENYDHSQVSVEISYLWGCVVTFPAKNEIQRVFCILPDETKI